MRDWLRNLFARHPGTRAFSFHDAGDWARAVPGLRQLAGLRPDDAEVSYRLGDSLYQLDRVQEALPHLERAVQLKSGVAAYHYKLGNVLKDLERPDEALAGYRRALELEPRHPQAANNTGLILETQGRLEEALHYYRLALHADGTLLTAHCNLAALLYRLERPAETAQAVAALMQLSPRSANDWSQLGNVCIELGRYDDALRSCERALALAARERGAAPGLDVAEMLNNIGVAYRQKGALETAEGYLVRAVEAAPERLFARQNLATVRYSLGRIDEAVAGYRDILAVDGQNATAARYLLMALLYTPRSNQELFAEHRSFARRFHSGQPTAPAPKSRGTSGRKIRIGYVSSDFRRHPVGDNLMPVIRLHDRERFEVYLYSAARHPDESSGWFRGQATAWRSIAYLPDEAAAQMIRQDEIDILVLLAGRFDDNRPLLATHRPAPIVVSLHDPATSGLDEVDYLIADRNLVPRHTTEQFTERVVCLPTFYLHEPLRDAPRSLTPPVSRKGWITFGSFNNPAKINDGVVAAWARLLHGMPGARLLLKYHGVFAAPGVRSRIANAFRRAGIGEERLLCPDHALEDHAQHLAHYGDIDIALDPFPFTGSTATFESLCMGVPVVTLEGDHMVARWSAAMLRKAGFPEWIARHEAEYVGIALKLAADPDRLARLRTELGERVARSPLCAGKARTLQLERLYRRMMTVRLARQSLASNALADATRT